MQQNSMHGMWSSRLAFILAAAGSAVGLGNIWRFPYLTSENGGGAFVLIYLGCIALVGLPLMWAEIALGRHGRMSPINTLMKLTREGGHSGAWGIIGWIGIIAAVLILSFYSVIGGWTLHYAWMYVTQLFGAAPISDPGATFGAMLGSPGTLLFWHSVFMGLTVGVVALGVEKGLERAVTVLMPLLFVLLLVLFGYAMTTGKVGQAFSFLFVADWSEVHGSTFLAALGQAFFSLSLGMCTMMTYGAYLPNNISIPRVGVAVAAMDTSVALLAGLAIFPIVFAFGLDAGQGGPGLIFTVLPLAFNDMPLGIPYAIAFFILLAVAAWTSSISLLEPPAAYAIERLGMSRKKAAILVAIGIWVFGIITVLSFNVWSHIRVFGRDLQGAIEFVASDLFLPIGGMLIALFTGWALRQSIVREEMSGLSAGMYQVWLWLLRLVVPALVLVVLARAFL